MQGQRQRMVKRIRSVRTEDSIAPAPAGEFDPSRLHRVVLVGTSGAGKSTVGERLAAGLEQPFVELDELFWSSGWQPKPEEAFLALVREAASRPRWVVAGNYRSARQELWPRASAVIWLNFSLGVVLRRVIARTFGRLVHKQELWHGNRESWWRTLFTRDSIVWWTVATHRGRRREFAALRSSAQYPQLQWYEFRRPADVERFLRQVAGTSFERQSSAKPRLPAAAAHGR